MLNVKLRLWNRELRLLIQHLPKRKVSPLGKLFKRHLLPSHQLWIQNRGVFMKTALPWQGEVLHDVWAGSVVMCLCRWSRNVLEPALLCIAGEGPHGACVTAGPALQTNNFKGFMERNPLRAYVALELYKYSSCNCRKHAKYLLWAFSFRLVSLYIKHNFFIFF